MIFQSFIRDNLVSLCMKIINSVVVVGLYYGLLTTFSIGPSYLFLLRARVIEEGTGKKVSATIGFITGQLIMFISIYYAPLHLALGRPHIITFITLPYLLFHFFGKNHKHFLNYGYKNPNSIRNFSIQKRFLNNFFFQLLNPLFLPSSILLRLINLYMFRCNNKLLFLTSSFGGWLIGHIVLMKWIEFILVWIQQTNSIQSNVPMQSNRFIMSEFRNLMSQIFIVFLFVTCLYYLGKIPLPFLTKDTELAEFQKKSEEFDTKQKIDVKRISETTVTKKQQKGSTENDLSTSLFSKKKKNLYKIDHEENIFGLKKYLVSTLFDSNRRIRPLRYIKNDRFESVIRNEISQFFFHICQSDGKERISFTYPPNLFTFLKMMEKRIYLFTGEKISYDEFSNYWNSNNEEKKKKLSNEFLNRAKVIDTEFIPLDIFENRIRLCNDETQRKYLIKTYDPLLRGPFRGRIKKNFSTSMKNENYTKNYILINKIHGILLYIPNHKNCNFNSNYPEFEDKIDTFDTKSLLTEISFFFFKLIRKFSEKTVSSLNYETLCLFPEQVKMYSKKRKTKIKFLFDTIRIDRNDKTIVKKKKKCFGIDEITKKVPRWSYKLIDELEQLGGKIENYQIRSRKAKRVVILTKKSKNDDTHTDTKDTDNTDNTDKKGELALIRYAQQPDFRRDIITGSIRAQRRKTVTWKLFQESAHSPLFLDKIEKTPFFFFFSGSMKLFFLFKNWMQKKTELKISDSTAEGNTKESDKKGESKRQKKEKDAKRRIEIAEAWDDVLFAQAIRGFLLITQSILRKYLILPSLIITKNIVRILLFQFPEWSEDFRDWNREMHVKCTYNGVQLSEKEFPKKWLTDGIQIKILFPFRLKPWHRSNLQPAEKEKKYLMKKKKKNFCFLTIWGGEVELPFSSYPRDRLSFFYPIFKELRRKTKKWKKNFFLVLNERTKLFLNVSKEITKWMIKNISKSILVLNEKRKQLPNYLFILKLKKKNELIENEKDSKITKNNPLIYESSMSIQSINWTNCSLTEKKIKDLNVKTKTIIKQIEKITKEKKGKFKISEVNINSKKTTFSIKRLELEKNILPILQRRKVRLTRKSYSFFKFFVERVYIDIFVCIISIPKINVQLFFESTKKILNKSIYNNESNTERIFKTNQNIIHFLSIIHKYYNTVNTNSQNSCDVSSLSQAYVFFKLSQTKVFNVYKCKLRSVFEYHGRYLFLKNEIGDSFFGARVISHSKLKHKNPPDSVMNQWANWLRGNYQYDLSHSRWSRLVPQKWRGRINESHMVQKKDLSKFDSYEKTQPILYKKKQVDSLTLKKKTQYGYDFLSYKSINYADNKDSYISGYRSPFQANKKQAFSYNYNTHKQKLFDIMGTISIKNYIAEDAIIEMEKNTTRKYFDWMEMNVEIQNRSRSNLEFVFFSKFLIFLNAYLSNPWIIPIKFPFFHHNENKNITEKKKKNGKKNKIDIFRRSKKKKYLSFESVTRNRSKAEEEVRIDIESPSSNQETNIEEDYVTSGGKGDKGTKKKRYKNKMEAELHFLLRKYLGFHLKWGGSLTQRILNNVKIYCLLIRLKNLKEIAIASIQRGELSLDIMVIQSHKDFTLKGLKKTKDLMKKRILIIEPVRLSRKNNEQFFMYQTTGFSLIHNSKDQIHQRYSEKGHVDKKNYEKYILRTRDQKITENKEKNPYNLFVPEKILSARRRRKLRILICFNPRNRNNTHRNKIFFNENKVNNFCQVLMKKKDLDRDKKKLMNLKLFLWPNFRLEDLACINRYWFDTHNGSRFSIVRIYMYPRFKIRKSTTFSVIYRNIYDI
uniref:Hypothetical chloroplast RF19 n=1 Tax=Mirbelia oxylobioides TaxID=140937 RepID=A0A6H0EF76_9FABA|nr:hypothetical chloroplast RF19 [Mirbelia oxylobioides]QIT00434.1 hypothetical chloroplast RF19 [Mirbelia oxylobioides]